MDAEKREESKENPRAQKYILEVHWKFICKVLDRAEHEILWNGGAHRLYLVYSNGIAHSLLTLVAKISFFFAPAMKCFGRSMLSAFDYRS